MAAKAQVPPQNFFDLDMRVGRVVSVEEFPEARTPAYKVAVDFGEVGCLRTSAQVTHYPAADLEGRLVVGAVNLGAKRIAGFTSEFLLLGAYGPDGVVRLLQPDDGATPGDSIG
jgi:tRNA-binding protein